jgi:hypothetical protein
MTARPQPKGVAQGSTCGLAAPIFFPKFKGHAYILLPVLINWNIYNRAHSSIALFSVLPLVRAAFPTRSLTAGFHRQLPALTGRAHHGDHLLAGPISQLQKKSTFVLQIESVGCLILTRTAAALPYSTLPLRTAPLATTGLTPPPLVPTWRCHYMSSLAATRLAILLLLRRLPHSPDPDMEP